LEQRREVIDRLCLVYPVWFFELLTEVEGKPFILEDYQIAYLLDESQFKITNKTRQAGASLIVAAAKFWKAYRNEYYRCDIVSISKKEAQSKITYIYGLWDSLPKRWKHPLTVNNQFSIGFHEGSRQSIINSMAASSSIRGGKKDLVIDEAAHIKNMDRIFVAALPATIRGHGCFDIISTPLGQRGKFWEIFSNQDRLYDEWSRHQFVWFDVSFFCTNKYEARRVWEEEYQQNWAFMPELVERFGSERLKQYARTMTNEEFEQEFCGRFVDESQAFFPWELILACQKHDEKQSEEDDEYYEKWLQGRPEHNDNPVYIGIDFAEGKKGGDSTSIQVFERMSDGTLVHRFYADLGHESGYRDFDSQLAYINDLIRRMRPQAVRVDETGLGRKLSADLRSVHGSLIEPITFTNQNKEEMALNVKGLMERGKLVLQKDNRRLAAQIHNIKREITPSGNIRYSGEPHDDMFWALALACKGQNKPIFRIFTLD